MSVFDNPVTEPLGEGQSVTVPAGQTWVGEAYHFNNGSNRSYFMIDGINVSYVDDGSETLKVVAKEGTVLKVEESGAGTRAGGFTGWAILDE